MRWLRFRGILLVAMVGPLRTLTALILLVTSFSAMSAQADAPVRTLIPGLNLVIRPIVDVGSVATFRLTALTWPGPARVTLRVTSPHHAFTGAMLWESLCGCFQLSLRLSTSIHPLEVARAWAVVSLRSGSTQTAATFSIRGLTLDGVHLSPGGTPLLAVWVGDPRPARDQLEHFCAWVHASDAVGFPGVTVRFLIRYTGKIDEVVTRTNTDGLACTSRPIDAALPGARVPVDVFSGRLHATAAFTLRG